MQIDLKNIASCSKEEIADLCNLAGLTIEQVIRAAKNKQNETSAILAGVERKWKSFPEIPVELRGVVAEIRRQGDYAEKVLKTLDYTQTRKERYTKAFLKRILSQEGCL